MQNSPFNFSTVEIQTIADNLTEDFPPNQGGNPKEHPMACCCCCACAVVMAPNEEE